MIIIKYASILLAAALALPAQAQVIPNSRSWYLHWRNDKEVRQYVLEVGRGPTVVVIHGGFGAEHSYLLEPLVPLTSNYRMVFYDQRGSLRSPAGNKEISLSKLVDDLEALRQQLGEEKLVLLTHSMGAATAMGYLMRYPERVRGLVLTAPMVPAEGERSALEAPLDPDLLTPEEQAQADARFAAFWAGEQQRVAQVKARLAPAPSSTAGSDRYLTDQWHIEFGGVNLYHVERWSQVMGGKNLFKQEVADAIMADREAWQRWLKGFRPALASFRGPVDVVMGDTDFTDPGAGLWRKVLQRVGNAKLTVLPEAGHAYWIDQPGLSHGALEAALQHAFEPAGGKR